MANAGKQPYRARLWASRAFMRGQKWKLNWAKVAILAGMRILLYNGPPGWTAFVMWPQGREVLPAQPNVKMALVEAIDHLLTYEDITGARLDW